MTHVAHGFMFFPDVSFPFAYETQTDPFTGASDGILARCASRGNCPKVIHTHTATEYWQSGQSLITTDALGQPRRHGAGSGSHLSFRRYPACGNPDHAERHLRHPLQHRRLPSAAAGRTRIARSLGEGWRGAAAKPPSSHRRWIAGGDDGAQHCRFPAFRSPQGPNQRPRFDYGPDFGKGIISKTLPVMLEDSYRVLVPKVDADGNETAGVRLPDVAVPTATITGWAVRSGEAGAAGELCYLDGSRLPFARSKAEREANGDPRPSLEERYRGPADYAAKVRSAAGALAQEGYLLPEDVHRITERAASMAW